MVFFIFIGAPKYLSLEKSGERQFKKIMKLKTQNINNSQSLFFIILIYVFASSRSERPLRRPLHPWRAVPSVEWRFGNSLAHLVDAPGFGSG